MRVAVWNVQSGGFTTYDHESHRPERLPNIGHALRMRRPDVAGLVDTWRWAEIFTEEELCDEFGFTQAYSINMEDERVEPQVGLTLLLNEPAECQTVRLKSRNAIKATLKGPDGPRYLYLVYLDDLSRAARLAQIGALLADIAQHADQPVMVMGDLNEVRPEAVPRMVRLLAWALRLPPLRWWRSYGPMAVRDLARPAVVSLLRWHGFEDAGAAQPRRATAFPRWRRWQLALAVDFILTRNWPIESYQVGSRYGADHCMVCARVGD